MEKQTFNEWITYIYREAGWPEHRIAQYDTGKENKDDFQRGRPCAPCIRQYATKPKAAGYQRPHSNQRRDVRFVHRQTVQK
jgi:hypothetical protein